MTTPTGAPATFAAVGKLEWAPTNGPYDQFPTWVDISQFMETQAPGAPVAIGPHGAQSELDSIESTQLTCTLKNVDNRFTFGYTAGPYGSNWGPSKQIRYSETYGGRTFVLFKGWIDYPDIPSWQPIGQQYVSLSATDRLARFDAMQPFISNLGALIQANPSLAYYYPLNDAQGSAYATPAVGPGRAAVTPVITTDIGTGATSTYTGIAFGTADRPPADDLSSCCRWTRQSPGFSGSLRETLPTPLAAVAGQQVAVVVWCKPALLPTATTSAQLGVVRVLQNGLSLANLEIDGPGSPTTLPGTWLGEAGITTTLIDVNGPTAAYDRWTIAAVVFTVNSPGVQLWVDDAVFTGTGLPSFSAITFSDIWIGNRFNGSIAHVQVYVGDPSAFTRAMFLAQRQVGLTGLEGQTTGQRVNTILDYAGVGANDRLVDPGQSYMQVAKLGGQTPLQALQNAANTERGRLFISGDGRTVFHDRVRTYNL